MSSFRAKLAIDGKSYNLKHCSFGFQQNIQVDGTPHSEVVSGLISIILEDPAPEIIRTWMMNPKEAKSGKINFYEVNHDIGTYQVLEFTDGYCIQFSNTFSGDKNDIGTLVSALTISAKQLKVTGK